MALRRLLLLMAVAVEVGGEPGLAVDRHFVEIPETMKVPGHGDGHDPAVVGPGQFIAVVRVIGAPGVVVDAHVRFGGHRAPELEGGCQPRQGHPQVVALVHVALVVELMKYGHLVAAHRILDGIGRRDVDGPARVSSTTRGVVTERPVTVSSTPSR